MSAGTSDPWGEKLPRRLGVWSATAVLVGSTIGSGIFRTPAVVADRIDTLGLFALAWILGGMVALCGALSYAELAAMYPRTGGIYVFVREGFGRLWAFLFGWAELVVLRPAAYGAIGLVSAEYLWRVVGVDGELSVGLGVSLAQVTGAALIIVVAAINYRGISWGALVQNISTVLKVGALLSLVLLGFALTADPILPAHDAPHDVREMSTISAFGLAMVSVLWSYDGWADVGFVSGEVKDPQRSLPRAFVLGTGSIVIMYLAINAVYLHVVPLRSMPGSPLIAADVAEAVIGPAGVVFVAGAICISTFGTLNGSMMTAPRIFYAMADDGLFFDRLARVHPRYGTPSGAIVLSAVLGVVFVSIRTFAELADQFIIGIWPFYALGVVAVFVLRRRLPDADRPYRTWGYPIVPLVFMAATLFLLGNYLVTEPLTFAVDIAVIASGVPVYFYWKRRRAHAVRG